MSEIICPNCSKAFKIDNAGYASIVKQIRDNEFNKEVNDKIKKAEEAVTLKNTIANESKINEKESIIQGLKSNIKNYEDRKKTEISEIENNLKSKIIKLENELKTEEKIQEGKFKNFETEKKLEIAKSTESIKKENNELTNKLNNNNLEKQNLKISLEQDFSQKLKGKDAIIQAKEDEIARIKDMKQKLSTKMVGESLEQHCENEFNKIRPTAFPDAEFEKDNDISSGTKGDYIYRERDENGVEIISIMFEMKNENEDTLSKKKNEDFFAKLDKDRKNKKCEYAVLVSLLEADSDFYNTGICDVFYRFKKMYVIRPQFFIAIISLLRNSALNSLKYKKELEKKQNEELDVSNFENGLNEFKNKFSKNYKSASENFKQAIDQIDKSIKAMAQVKSKLITTENQLQYANNKAQDLTIKKLTYNNPTMKEKFLLAKK
jgi:hypothetical protein